MLEIDFLAFFFIYKVPSNYYNNMDIFCKSLIFPINFGATYTARYNIDNNNMWPVG